MKRLIRYLITIICGFMLNCPIFADNTHILVFRHSGSIESYEISKVSSIELSEIDEKGNVYDTPVSQIFRIGEKSVVIPIEDIDSVSFGDRNCIVARKDARRILDSELQFISKYDGSELLYSSATPSSAIPNVGEKVYYDNFCDIFPFGLCAEIKSRTMTSEGYILHTEDINPDKVFEEFIVSGDFEYVPIEKSTRAELEAGFSHDTEFDFPPLRMESSIAGGLSFKNFIGCPRKNYYSADIY
ncbi:MAG: hypothetical protein K2H15_03440, partial [Muribaculaceae bacterium]|nr:hypothetical protein [Muribaculaceae bacterium]